MSQTFQKKVEDFVCEKCGAVVKGNGYTNHCPHCLWSRHVDVNPGDRASECWGMMEPVSVEKDGGDMILTHKCIKCGYSKRNKVAPEDNVNALAAVAQKMANKFIG